MCPLLYRPLLLTALLPRLPLGTSLLDSQSRKPPLASLRGVTRVHAPYRRPRVRPRALRSPGALLPRLPVPPHAPQESNQVRGLNVLVLPDI